MSLIGFGAVTAGAARPRTLRRKAQAWAPRTIAPIKRRPTAAAWQPRTVSWKNWQAAAQAAVAKFNAVFHIRWNAAVSQVFKSASGHSHAEDQDNPLHSAHQSYFAEEDFVAAAKALLASPEFKADYVGYLIPLLQGSSAEQRGLATQYYKNAATKYVRDDFDRDLNLSYWPTVNQDIKRAIDDANAAAFNQAGPLQGFGQPVTIGEQVAGSTLKTIVGDESVSCHVDADGVTYCAAKESTLNVRYAMAVGAGLLFGAVAVYLVKK